MVLVGKQAGSLLGTDMAEERLLENGDSVKPAETGSVDANSSSTRIS